jgi:CCR4-NOT transcription complex subunit 6
MPDNLMNYALSSLNSGPSLLAQQQAMQSSGLLGTKSLGPPGPHHQKQLELAQLSRGMTSQHHHTRLATTAARTGVSGLTASNPLLIIGDTPSKGQFDKIEETKWSGLDLGGLGLLNVSRDLFLNYNFLTALYLNHNRLTSFPPEISRLRHLVHLDLSGNKLTTLPPEIGFVTSLKELWLFDNQIQYLPSEIGQLYQLEFLGIEGNMIGEPLESMIRTEGSVAAIHYLRDTCPGIHPF